MRGLNPDRNPCVQGSIRSLGFNFTDWFAPFFSVRILTRKVASAEPLYYIKLAMFPADALCELAQNIGHSTVVCSCTEGPTTQSLFLAFYEWKVLDHPIS